MPSPEPRLASLTMSCLIVFAKVPEPGRVKTRLSPPLSPDQAAQLYEAFLHDALRQYASLGVDVRLYLAPSTQPLPPLIVPAGVSVHTQSGVGLGKRMWNAFVEVFAAGYTDAVVIGTDHPTLPSGFVEQAFVSLETPLSLCIGPSEDGGYYLLGMNDLYPSVFRDMTYSHTEVFNDTLDRARHTRATLTILPAWYDVDTEDELIRLVDDLAASTDSLPATRALLPWLQPIVEDLLAKS